MNVPTCTHDIPEQESACTDGYCPLCAAAEIERLTAESERLRATLKDIQAKSVSFRPPRFTWFYDRAEEALNQQLSVKDQSNGG